jgi:hypothetical protein
MKQKIKKIVFRLIDVNFPFINPQVLWHHRCGKNWFGDINRTDR